MIRCSIGSLLISSHLTHPKTMAIKTDIGTRQEDLVDSQSVHRTIEQLFAESAYHELRQIYADVTPGLIELTGTVPSFFIKQVAQESVRQVCGIRKIRNMIDVT